MDYDNFEQPPAKKRRFFLEPESSPLPPLPRHAQLEHTEVETAAQRSPLSEQDVNSVFGEIPTSPPVRVTSPTREAPTREATTPSLAFDKETFESFVGTKVKPSVIELIQEHCGDDIERAVNIYFDGTYKHLKRKPKRSPSTQHGATQTPAISSNRAQTGPSTSRARQRMPEARYIGAFGCEGWVTRSGTNLLKYGDTVKIERQKMQALMKRRGPNAAAKADVIVRFTDAHGREVGRLAKDTADWVSTLIDHNMCRFEGTVVYADERLTTNATVFLQLKCFLLRSAFNSRGFEASDKRKTSLFEKDETDEERGLRLRQVALVRLFKEINMVPTRGSATSERDHRQALLEAAELADKEDKKPGRSAESDNPGSSPSSDDNEDGQELEQDQLDTLYKKAQTFDFNTPEAEPADTFAMNLRPYQKQSLYWMMAKEKDERNKNREISMHPLWEEYTWPTKDHDDKDLPEVADQPTFYINPYSGDMSLEFPEQEQHCLGGILADEMGLGKTIQMLSLIHSHKSDIALAAKQPGGSPPTVNKLRRLPAHMAGIVDAPCTTLVIAPMSLLAQWQSEAENASNEGTLKSMVYYGSDKKEDLRALCCAENAASAPDVLITSFGTVLSEFNQVAARGGDRGATQGIFALNFFRVIIDEAHNIKNRQSKTARACYEVAAEHRWALTGTPIVNRLEDLYSLIRFLRVEPWNNFSFWRTFITVPFESKDFMRALDVVQTVLEPLVMRRTKDMKAPNGEPLVALPPKKIEIVDIELSEEERAVYNFIFARVRDSFNANMEAGTLMKSYTSILSKIMRLRQTCCHPILVRNQDVVAEQMEADAAADAAAGFADDMDLQALIEQFTATTDDAGESNAFGAHVLKQIRDEAANECPICSEEPMIEQTVTGCWHSACKKCLSEYIQHQRDRNEAPRCFQCREIINTRDLFEVVRHEDEPTGSPSGQPRISLQRIGKHDSSAKIVTLIEHLRALRKEHPTMKSVVFSQFTSFLSLIEPALKRANMKFLRLDGTMAQKARAAVLEEFKESKQFTILLISLRAGGVGLNLTSAKRVFMMDPWWSFAVEAQAIDRIHRMGQEDEVKVYRFIVKDSVEQRMLRIQDRKKFIASSLGMMSDEEKKSQRIEDIRELLS